MLAFKHLAPRACQRQSAQAGLSLVELIIASSILLILSSAALPIVRATIVRQKESELSRDLHEMRDAIDRYKDLADQGKIRIEAGTEGYPPDLETLVKGVNIGATDFYGEFLSIP